ncbi:MAG: hypothetical protein ACPIOQ_63750, partial [Promethearchaeia archaeon]
EPDGCACLGDNSILGAQLRIDHGEDYGKWCVCMCQALACYLRLFITPSQSPAYRCVYLALPNTHASAHTGVRRGRTASRPQGKPTRS